MRVLYLGTDGSGRSYFEDHDTPLTMHDFAPPAPEMFMSEPVATTNLRILELPVGWRDDRHCSPKRQIAFCLSGRMKVTASDGETRMVEPGGVWHMEDVTGEGHGSEVVGDSPARLVIVQLE